MCAGCWCGAWILAVQRAPRVVFLGDVGSYFFGSLVAMLAVEALRTAVPVLVVVAPLLVYVIDVTSTLIRRLVQRENVLQPHRTHLYQQLTQVGLRHTAATVVHAGFTCWW